MHSYVYTLTISVLTKNSSQISSFSTLLSVCMPTTNHQQQQTKIKNSNEKKKLQIYIFYICIVDHVMQKTQSTTHLKISINQKNDKQKNSHHAL